jgi:hypothetical protein
MILLLTFGTIQHSEASDENDYLIAGIAITGVVDTYSSGYGIGKGIVHESNPALKWAADQPLVFGLVKGTWYAAVLFILNKYKDSHPDLVKWFGRGILGFNIGVVGNNIYVINKSVEF